MIIVLRPVFTFVLISILQATVLEFLNRFRPHNLSNSTIASGLTICRIPLSLPASQSVEFHYRYRFRPHNLSNFTIASGLTICRIPLFFSGFSQAQPPNIRRYNISFTNPLRANLRNTHTLVRPTSHDKKQKRYWFN